MRREQIICIRSLCIEASVLVRKVLADFSSVSQVWPVRKRSDQAQATSDLGRYWNPDRDKGSA